MSDEPLLPEDEPVPLSEAELACVERAADDRAWGDTMGRLLRDVVREVRYLRERATGAEQLAAQRLSDLKLSVLREQEAEQAVTVLAWVARDVRRCAPRQSLDPPSHIFMAQWAHARARALLAAQKPEAQS